MLAFEQDQWSKAVFPLTPSSSGLSNMSNTKDSVYTTFPNTEKRVGNTTRRRISLTNLEVFVNVVKHCLECLICLRN